ncbi:aminoacyl-tRNA hydrolase [Chloroflexota bacterium]
MKLIVGLGNPGRNYSHNRHNIGFMCVNHFARTRGIHFDKKQGQARIGTGETDGNKLIVARPQSGMNLSGQAVSRLVNRFKINPEDLIVIHDDLDLATGKIRIRQGSSSGGHKGIDSIIAHLESPDFIRIRVGIGRPPTTEVSSKDKEAEVIDHVLSDFSPEEEKIINRVIPKVSEAIICLLEEGLTATMNKYN